MSMGNVMQARLNQVANQNRFDSANADFSRQKPMMKPQQEYTQPINPVSSPIVPFKDRYAANQQKFQQGFMNPPAQHTTPVGGGRNFATLAQQLQSGQQGYRGGNRMGARPSRPAMFGPRQGRGGATPYANQADYTNRNSMMRAARQSYFADQFRNRSRQWKSPTQSTQPIFNQGSYT